MTEFLLSLPGQESISKEKLFLEEKSMAGRSHTCRGLGAGHSGRGAVCRQLLRWNQLEVHEE